MSAVVHTRDSWRLQNGTNELKANNSTIRAKPLVKHQICASGTRATYLILDNNKSISLANHYGIAVIETRKWKQTSYLVCIIHFSFERHERIRCSFRDKLYLYANSPQSSLLIRKSFVPHVKGHFAAKTQKVVPTCHRIVDLGGGISTPIGEISFRRLPPIG